MNHQCSLLAVFAAFPLLVTQAHAKPGSLDTTFGTGGLVVTNLNQSDAVHTLAIQPDGKIVAAGHLTGGGHYQFGLARYNPDGSLDTNFGIDGKAFTDVGSQDSVANAMILQPDGGIVLAGSSNSGDDDFALVRYLGNGSLDTTFGTGGIVTTPIGSGNNAATAMARQPDGKLVVAGQFHNGNDFDFAVARYSKDGVLDTTFSVDGIVTTPIGVLDDLVEAVVLEPSGKIVVAGITGVNGQTDLAIVRYNPNGTLDNTFGSGGIVITPILSNDDSLKGMARQPDGKFVLAGSCWNGSGWDTSLVRLNENGSLDNSFGTGGLAVTTQFNSIADTASAVSLQPDGKIVVAGEVHNGGATDFALARFRRNGTLDGTFGSGGIVTTPFSSNNDSAYAMALQPDGRIVAGGVSNGDFALARYNARIQPDARLGLKTSATLGNNRYNGTGEGQKLPTRIRRDGGVRTVFVKIQNDGNENDSFKVKGTGSNRKFAVKYFHGSRDVTSKVIAGTLKTGPLAPAAVYPLTMKVSAKTKKRNQERAFSIIPTSLTDSAARDRVVVSARSR